ncbi:metal-dependent transcriptional regulator [Flavisolibacter ginsenosidimutans]|uniref:Transcriptional regulator MntR n=1 Tax=Flavisolibacter ginsenosidimutans TaxID=661481 RepID=A0A5B8UIK8_9BACT|nr:metal-dependent transcriptional regulator [Flavisolibacter ginsenosidimutans]QEC56373.1 metal-dependent transcriptional regulator [Flavisolibacter ginsenosidimutans]
MNYSISEENYLKAIYHLQEKGGTASTNAVAEQLNTKAASVTDMMKKLSAKGLLNYTPYYGFSLSTEGKKTALFIIRRHRLWEFFLSQKLGFSWEEVHGLAEELEHVSSKKLIDRLDEFLGFPPYDPHGDPIPDSKGKITARNQLPLSLLPLHKSATVCRVANQSAEMLELLKHKAIAIGTKLEVKKHFPFDQSIEIKLKTKTVTISEQAAKNIFVVYE